MGPSGRVRHGLAHTFPAPLSLGLWIGDRLSCMDRTQRSWYHTSQQFQPRRPDTFSSPFHCLQFHFTPSLHDLYSFLDHKILSSTHLCQHSGLYPSIWRFYPGYGPILVQRRSNHLLTRYSPRHPALPSRESGGCSGPSFLCLQSSKFTCLCLAVLHHVMVLGACFAFEQCVHIL